MKYTACVLSLVTTGEERSTSVLEVDLSSLAGVSFQRILEKLVCGRYRPEGVLDLLGGALLKKKKKI